MKLEENKVEELVQKLGLMRGDIITSAIVLNKVNETLERISKEFEPIIDAVRRKN